MEMSLWQGRPKPVSRKSRVWLQSRPHFFSHMAPAWRPELAKLGPSCAQLCSPGALNLCPVNILFPCQGFFPFFLPASATCLDFLVNFLLMASNFAWLSRGEKEVSPCGSGLGERARGPGWLQQWLKKGENMYAWASNLRKLPA